MARVQSRKTVALWRTSFWLAGALLLGLLGPMFQRDFSASTPVALARGGGYVPVQNAGGEAVPLRLPPGEVPVILPEETAPSGPLPRPEKAVVQLAIVLDDMGLKQRQALRAVALPVPISLAFLPYAAATPRLAQAAGAAGHEILLHMPMQPLGRADPGPQALRLTLSDAQVRARLDWALTQVPGANGLNNHMGSAYTQSPHAMALVGEWVQTRQLFWLDSRTIADSAARSTARRLGLPFAERDVFLDNQQSARSVLAQLAQAEALARQFGTAIAIGHPHEVTLSVLAEWLPQAQARGVAIVSVATVIATRRTPQWRQMREAL